MAKEIVTVDTSVPAGTTGTGALNPNPTCDMVEEIVITVNIPVGTTGTGGLKPTCDMAEEIVTVEIPARTTVTGALNPICDMVEEIVTVDIPAGTTGKGGDKTDNCGDYTYGWKGADKTDNRGNYNYGWKFVCFHIFGIIASLAMIVFFFAAGIFTYYRIAAHWMSIVCAACLVPMFLTHTSNLSGTNPSIKMEYDILAMIVYGVCGLIFGYLSLDLPKYGKEDPKLPKVFAHPPIAAVSSVVCTCMVLGFLVLIFHDLRCQRSRRSQSY